MSVTRGADDTPPTVPDDVWRWVKETYTEDGASTWLIGWSTGSEEKRRRMAALARTPEMGT